MGKEYTKEALMYKTKSALAEYILCLEHHNKELEQVLDIQARNYIKITSWIPVKDAMPAVGDNVLVSLSDNNIMVARFMSDGFWYSSETWFRVQSEVLAWMKLFCVYKE